MSCEARVEDRGLVQPTRIRSRRPSVASSLRQKDREISTSQPGPKCAKPAGTTTAFRPSCTMVTPGTSSHRSDPGERQSAEPPYDGPQPALALRRHGEQQLVVVAAGQRASARITALRLEPRAASGSMGSAVGVDPTPRPLAARDLRSAVGEAVAQIHARAGRLSASEQPAEPDARLRPQDTGASGRGVSARASSARIRHMLQAGTSPRRSRR